MSDTTIAQVPSAEEQVKELEALLETEKVMVNETGLKPHEIAKAIAQPFDPSVRKYKGGFAYIPQAVVRRRINNATNNLYDWQVLKFEFRDGTEVQQPNTLIMIVHGRLTIPGLGSRDGIGTAIIRKGTEEQYKSAESDAYKRAAMAFGTGLENYPGDLESLPQGYSETIVPTSSDPQDVLPTDPTLLDAELAQQKVRISAAAMKTYNESEGWTAKNMSELTYEQKRQLLRWARRQPDRAKPAA